MTLKPSHSEASLEEERTAITAERVAIAKERKNFEEQMVMVTTLQGFGLSRSFLSLSLMQTQILSLLTTILFSLA